MADRKFLYIDDIEMGPTESDPVSDTISLAGMTLSGNLSFAGGATAVGVPSPANDTDVVNKLYVDNAISGTPWKSVQCIGLIDDSLNQPAGGEVDGDSYIVGASPSGAWSSFSHGDLVQLVGGTWVVILAGGGSEPADGCRVVITGGTSGGSFVGEENNIAQYNATANTWSFDAASDGKAVIVSGEGANSENQGWVFDSSVPAWVRFGSDLGAGNGLTKTAGNILNVGTGDGIKVNADSIEVDLSANAGLELSGTSPNKTLQAQIDGAHGIIIGTSGLEIEIDDTPDTLDMDVDGLKVVGVPSEFKINNNPVSTNVTAGNLNTLTAGSASNADSLHTHTVTDVDEAKRVEDTHLNNVATSVGSIVCWSATNNEIGLADNSDKITSRVIGVVRTGGASNPGTSDVVKHGVCAGVLSSATVRDPYFLGATGNLVTYSSIPKPGRVIRMGFAVNSSDLDVQITDFGYRRA